MDAQQQAIADRALTVAQELVALADHRALTSTELHHTVKSAVHVARFEQLSGRTLWPHTSAGLEAK